jgi:hypothetical protein
MTHHAQNRIPARNARAGTCETSTTTSPTTPTAPTPGNAPDGLIRHPSSLLPPDLAASITARIAEQIATARRRADERRALYEAKQTRRDAGLTRRHAVKLARLGASTLPVDEQVTR